MKLLAMMVVVAGCEWGGGTDSHGVLGVDAKVKMDAPGGGDTPPPPSGHVVLTEIVLNSIGGEFVEIYNPTSTAVDLTHYYLADVGTYWQLPAGVPNVLSSDFIAQFPPGSLGPGAVATISISAAATYMGIYGTLPSYSVPTMIQTAVGTAPTLTDGGEVVVLFSWDGTGDLVKDVDIMIAGMPSGMNLLTPSKSGQMQGGSTYATDSGTIAPQTATPGLNLSTKRIAAESGHETTTASNGITGHDETSENTGVTWDTTFTAPTPGMVPPGL